MTGTTVAETQRRGLIAELAELQPVKRTFLAEHKSVQDFHFQQECTYIRAFDTSLPVKRKRLKET